VLTGDDVAKDNLGGLICGWMIHSKDGSPMKAGPHPLLAQGRARHVGDPVAVVIAETRDIARAAAESVNVDYKTLPAVVHTADAQKKGAAQVHDVAKRNTAFEWELGDKDATEAAFKQGSPRDQASTWSTTAWCPNAIEPRAAIGSYDTGEDHFTLYTTSQNPHVARLVISAFLGLAPEHKLRVVAPDVGGGFGSKIYIYNEEVICTWASKKIGGRPVKWTADRSEAS
jgi:carbon-monoxide dehydrogenase large subunit